MCFMFYEMMPLQVTSPEFLFSFFFFFFPLLFLVFFPGSCWLFVSSWCFIRKTSHRRTEIKTKMKGRERERPPSSNISLSWYSYTCHFHPLHLLLPIFGRIKKREEEEDRHREEGKKEIRVDADTAEILHQFMLYVLSLQVYSSL